MSSPEEYRAKADRYLRMARGTNGWVANLLLVWAAEYLELADAEERRRPVLQQQQPQPKQADPKD